jgi:hypothetical protein
MSVTTSGAGDVVRALAGARRAALAGYILPPGAVRGALEAAARRGADVWVRLEGRPYDGPTHRLRRENEATVAELGAAGVHAALTDPSEPLFHLKAAVIDGVAWLEDRNWAGGERSTILRDDDPADVQAAAAAIAGLPGRGRSLATTKRDALALEAAAIRAAGSEPLAVETESLGQSAVVAAIRERAAAHRPTRLLVARREAAGPSGGKERKLLAELARAGVTVRVGSPTGPELAEKLAVGAREGWVGSANASAAIGPFGEQRDWGLAVRTPALLRSLRGAFERNWRAAVPLR